jgi:hypothetical protein
VVVPVVTNCASLLATNEPMSACASSVDPPMCGVRMTLGSPRSSETNSSPRGRVVDDEAPAEVEEEAARLHPGELLLAEESAVAGPAVDVQAHHVGDGKQFLQRGAPPRVAQRELVGGVVEVDPHAQGLGQHRQLSADVAVPDDAQHPSPHLVAALGRLVPDAVVHAGVLVGQSPGQRDDLGQGQLHHATGVGERCVEHRHAPRGGGDQVDLVGADAERADREQPGRGVEHRGRHLGLGPDTEQVHVGHALDQLGLVQRPAQRLDVDAVGLQPGYRIRVDALE